MQFLCGTLALALALAGEAGGVAWWAGVGGFVAGMALAGRGPLATVVSPASGRTSALRGEPSSG